MVSSSRMRLNGWLPLYVNAEHWARAGHYSPSAFARLAARKPGTTFQPKDALNVCCSLLSCAVSGFTVGQMDPTCASPRTANRGKANERAVQMYADIHRLFLQIAREHPEVRKMAFEQLWRFIRDPAMRTRKRTPSLGNLVQCLLIAEEVTWKDLAPSIIPEAFRRHVLRQEYKQMFFSSQNCGASIEQLISAWDHFAPQASMVLSCSVLFYRCMVRPEGHSLDDVEAAYDRCWGRLRHEAMIDIIGICENLCQQHSVMDFFPTLLSGTHSSLGEPLLPAEQHECQRTDHAVAELILWAERYGHGGEDAGVIPADQWPEICGACPLLQKWKEDGLRQKCLSKERQPGRRQPRQRVWQSGRRHQRRHQQDWQGGMHYHGVQWHDQLLQDSFGLQAQQNHEQMEWLQSMQYLPMNEQYLEFLPYPQNMVMMPR